MIPTGEETALDGPEICLYHNNPQSWLSYTVTTEQKSSNPSFTPCGITADFMLVAFLQC